MNRSSGYPSGRTPMIHDSPKHKNTHCTIFEDEKKSTRRFETTSYDCRFHKNCTVGWLDHQKNKPIFTRSCFNCCSLTVPLHEENAKRGAGSNKCNMNQMNDSTIKSQRLYEDPAVTACRTGNLKLLKDEKNNRPQITRERSLLFMAVKEGHLNIVQFLTGTFCQINFPNGKDSALHVAVRNGHLEIVKHLILSGSYALATNYNHKTALDIAFDNNHLKIIEELQKIPELSNVTLGSLNYSISMNDEKSALLLLSESELKDTMIEDDALKDCVKKSNLNMLKLLNDHKRINHFNSFELLYTAFNNRFNDDIAIWLIHNFDYSVISQNKKNIILQEAVKFDDKICHEILKSAAFSDTFVKEPLKEYLFTLFNENNNIENMRLLISEGVELTFSQVSDDDKENIISYLARKKAFASIRYLSSTAPSFNLTDAFNRYFLMAIKKHNLDMVKGLIAEGVDINKIDDSSGMAYLSYAIQNKCWDIVKLLIENKSKVNSVDRDTMKTPLHHAVETSDADIISLLLKKGANIKTKDKDKHTPLDYANEIGDTCIIEILVTEKYRLSILDKKEAIEYLFYLKTTCIENDGVYNDNDFSHDINKFEEAIRLFEYLDCTKIRIGETLHDSDHRAALRSGFSDSWFYVYYEEKLLCTITERTYAPWSDMRCEYEYKSGNIDTEDLFTELFYKMGATGCI